MGTEQGLTTDPPLADPRPHAPAAHAHDDEEGEPPGLRPKPARAPILGACRRRATARCARHEINTGTATDVPETLAAASSPLTPGR